jgi:hypothetical protein
VEGYQEKRGMFTVKMGVSAMNVRQNKGIINTMKLRQMVEMVKRMRLAELNKGYVTSRHTCLTCLLVIIV